MALSITPGINFPFNMQEKGVDETAGKVSKGMGVIGKAVGAVRSVVGGLTSDFGELTTAFEATLQKNRVQGMQVATQFGLAGKDASEFASKAQKMTLAIGTSFETNLNVLKAKAIGTAEAFRDFGLGSAESMAKFADVTGVNMVDLGDNFQALRKDLGLTQGQFEAVTGAALASGQAIKDIPGSLAGLGTLVTQLRTLKNAGNFNNDELTSIARQQYAIQSAAGKLGFHKEASGIASEATQHIVTSQQSMANLMAGLSSDIGENHLQGSMLMGSDAAFKTLRQGPAAYLNNLAKFLSANKGNGRATQFLNARLGQAGFGPEMLEFLSKLSENQGAISGEMGQKTSAGGVANQRVDPRTYQDRMYQAVDQFTTKVRSLVTANKDLVKDSESMLSSFGDKWAALGAEKGPLGNVIRKLAEAHEIGVAAFFEGEDRSAVKFLQTLTHVAAPAIASLDAMGLNINNLTSLWGPFKIAGTLAFDDLLINWVKMNGSISKAFTKTWGDIQDFYKKVKPLLLSVGNLLVDGIMLAWYSAAPAIYGILDAIGDYARSAFAGILKEYHLGMLLPSKEESDAADKVRTDERQTRDISLREMSSRTQTTLDQDATTALTEFVKQFGPGGAFHRLASDVKKIAEHSKETAGNTASTVKKLGKRSGGSPAAGPVVDSAGGQGR